MRVDGILKFQERICVLDIEGLRKLIMEEDYIKLFEVYTQKPLKCTKI